MLGRDGNVERANAVAALDRPRIEDCASIETLVKECWCSRSVISVTFVAKAQTLRRGGNFRLHFSEEQGLLVFAFRRGGCEWMVGVCPEGPAPWIDVSERHGMSEK